MKKTILINLAVAVVCLGIGFATQHYLHHTVTPAIEVQLTGKTDYDLGDIAEFSVDLKNAPKTLQKTVAWKVIKNNNVVDYKSLSDSNIIFPVGVKPTKMTLFMHLVYIDPKTKALTNSDFFVKDINVGGVIPPGPGPDPGPGPTPPPTPDPTPVDGKYKIAVFAYTNAKSLVKSNKLAAAAKALAGSYKATADEIDKNTYVTLKDVYAGLKTNNTAALNNAGESTTNWIDWEKVMQKTIGELYRNKQLPALSDHAGMFREIADGLSYVK